MRLRVVGDQCHVRPAQHDRDAAASQAIGELVRAHGRAGDHRQADQVGLDLLRVDVLDPLVETDDLRVQLRRDQGRQGRQGERHVAERPPEDAAAVPVQRPLRRDQHDAQLAVLHGSDPGTRERRDRQDGRCRSSRRGMDDPADEGAHVPVRIEVVVGPPDRVDQARRAGRRRRAGCRRRRRVPAPPAADGRGGPDGSGGGRPGATRRHERRRGREAVPAGRRVALPPGGPGLPASRMDSHDASRSASPPIAITGGRGTSRPAPSRTRSRSG